MNENNQMIGKNMTNISLVFLNLALANRRLHWDFKKLERFQEKRLRQVVKYAYDFVPFYHQFFKEAGINPSAIKSAKDLSKLPLVEKDVFRRQVPQKLVSKEFSFNKLKKVRTSGSTGKPFELFITGREDAWRKAIYMRANISCGQKPRDRWIVMSSPHHFHDTTNLQRKIGIYSQTCISLFESTEAKINQISAVNPDILDGYSQSLLLLAKEIERKGVKTINPRIMFGSAELISPQSQKYIEKVFDAPFYDQYGAAEVDRSAWQCPEKQGYHMDIDSVITEFVDKDGINISDGETGEIAFTSLFNFAMPLIRYKIGDVGASSDDTCSCWRNLPLMKVVEGRKDSFLKLPGGRVVSPMVFNYALSTFNYYSNIDQYYIRQKKIDFFEVKIKMVPGSFNEELIVSGFKEHIQKFFKLKENEIQFGVSLVDEIPLAPTGKFLSVTSDLKTTVGK
ncbi:phenylacetate--CoA ligase family protein [bacterium]|nr:MAG: phenylacetate--CoA ligase family protein [bacterium]